MNRRGSLFALVALCAASLSSKAQQSARPARIAWLGLGTSEANNYQVNAFRQRMRELGYVEGANFILDIRWAMGKPERLPELAQELVALKPEIILTGASAATQAAHKATNTIPIVMAAVSDPVASGFVKSLERPGGNITGLSILTTELSSKLLELLRSVVPKLQRVAVLWNPSTPVNAAMLEEVQKVAQGMKLGVLPSKAQNPSDIEHAFATMRRDHAGAVLVLSDAFLLFQRRQIADLALKHRLPSISALRESAEAGCLMSYGVDVADRFRRTANYVQKILKGAKPADLPIEQPMTFELVVNLKTAKALGITFPHSILVSANDVIK